jgi:hypothetical protein
MAAPNSFDVNDFLAREQLRVMTNKLVIGEAFDTSQNKLFTQSYMASARWATPSGSRTRASSCRARQQPRVRAAADVDRATFVTIDQISKVHFEYDVLDKALRMQDYEGAMREDIIEPAANTMAQDIEDRCAKYAYQHTPNIVGVLGTNPATFDASFGAAYERFINLGAGATEARDHRHRHSARADGRRARAVPAGHRIQPGDEGRLARPRVDVPTFVSPSLYRHTAGTWAGARRPCRSRRRSPADAGHRHHVVRARLHQR